MPEQIIQDQSQRTGILGLAFERIAGEGRVIPVIIVVAQMRTLVEEVEVTPFHMTAKLQLGSDVIGQGSLRRCGTEIRVYPKQVEFEIQTTERAINFVNEQFRDNYLSFSLVFDLLVQHTDNKTNQSRVIKAADSGLSFRVSKLDWLKQVLEPIGYADFTLIELPIPEIPNREQWTKALNHIGEAEAQYRTGNDPGVFSRCYAAYESIKPIKKHLESIVSEDKRNATKSVFDGMQRFLNQGRHVERSGAEPGEFPVDHRDAEFALYLTKSSMAYLAKLIHKV